VRQSLSTDDNLHKQHTQGKIKIQVMKEEEEYKKKERRREPQWESVIDKLHNAHENSR
jgi:hypothetical protein